MKKKIFHFCLLLLILLTPALIFSHASPHDSLLFDGNNQNSYYNSSCQCKVKVISYTGEVYGTRIIKEIYKVCGGIDSSEKLVRAQVHLGDELCIGDDDYIHTLDGTVKIQLRNGTVLSLKQNSKITIQGNYCLGKGAWIKIKNGGFCYDGGKANDENSLKCETKFSFLDILNTIYTVEVTDESETVKVYDGQVKVSLIKNDDSEKEKLAQQMKQLPQDYKDGKITKDELNAKMQEYNERIKYLNEHMNPVKIDPGNKCIITKSLLNVETIESGDEKWWEKIE